MTIWLDLANGHIKLPGRLPHWSTLRDGMRFTLVQLGCELSPNTYGAYNVWFVPLSGFTFYSETYLIDAKQSVR